MKENNNEFIVRLNARHRAIWTVFFVMVIVSVIFCNRGYTHYKSVNELKQQIESSEVLLVNFNSKSEETGNTEDTEYMVSGFEGSVKKDRALLQQQQKVMIMDLSIAGICLAGAVIIFVFAVKINRRVLLAENGISVSG